MPRIRSIKPQFWIDEDLAKVSREIRLLYIGLWNISDDGGVFEWRPGRIKALLFPHDIDIDSEKIISWLEELIKIGNIIKFNENGSIFGYILRFTVHQDIKKPSYWRFAKPPVTNQLPTSTPLVPKEYPSSSPKEEEKEEGGGKVDSISSSYNGQVFELFEENFQKITQHNSAVVNDLINFYGGEKVIEAMKESIKHNKRSLAYVEAILKGKNGKDRGNNQKRKEYTDPDEYHEQRRREARGID